MSSKSVYCLCKNRYLVEHLCKCNKQPYYWKQGIGQHEYTPISIQENLFDETFDETFN